MKLIPDILNPNTKSEAERHIYRLLEKSSVEGIAIHSLELKEHISKLYSEVDFLIITKRGVLCLEVKGGQIKVDNGEWIYTNRNDASFSTYESPFKQARGNKETLLKYVSENYTKKSGSEIKECIYGYGVVIPDTILASDSIEIDHELVYDYDSESFDGYINHLYDKWEERISSVLNGKSMPLLSNGHITLLIELLLGKSVEITKNLCDEFKSSDNLLKKLSDEQFKMFQFGMQNRRQLVKGGAGTGKTIIATKYAIEKADEGNKVLFICFNKLLSNSVLKTIHFSNKKNIRVVNFHDYLLEKTNVTIPNDKSELNDFYTNKLPEHYLDTFIETPKYDTLIVDEGQDLLFENYLMCLDQFVVGGLSNGNWLILYDENQNIYLKDAFKNGLKMVSDYNPSLGNLFINYRNTRQIDEKNKELTNIFATKFAGIDGEDVEIYEYYNKEQGKKRLKTIIKHLHKDGVENKDIVLLSRHRYENSLLEGKSNLLGKNNEVQALQDNQGKTVEVGERAIRFSSIYSFKGLESHVVILIDVDKKTEESSCLYYTAISRAKSKLIIMRDVY